ncbi:hypothetical protein C8J56DRAFT_36002 [Mycena floridula]|nr:hypothetical protein C8J56DRAFT_36002 [Mycena floridula]
MPSFLSKLVKNSSSPASHGRERSDSLSAPSSRSRSRSRTASTISTNVDSSRSLSKINVAVIPTIKEPATSISSAESFTHNVTVIPPSPLMTANDGLPEEEPEATQRDIDGLPNTEATNGITATISPSKKAAPSTPSRPSSRPTTPVSSKRETADVVPPVPSLRRHASDKSLNSHLSSPMPINHNRAATSPAEHPKPSDENGDIMTPISESPTQIRAPDLFPPRSNTLAPRDTSDTASVISYAPSIAGSPSKDKKQAGSRPWRRAPQSKPSGLASAIAASGLAMANPAALVSPPLSLTSPPPDRKNSISSRKGSNASSPPPMNRKSSGNGHPDNARPLRSKRSKAGSPKRRPSVSVHSDNNSEHYHEEHAPDYYSGLEESTSEEDSSDRDDDDLMDLDLEENAVTGFAVASNRRNADFHEMFPVVPDSDYLIEDYGCALQREILIQGRLYISENHICFHANIFGWVTDVTVPISEIETLEKKMTAFVIPNAILITTRQNKYSFASFLSRDTTFDVIYNIWRLARPGADTRSIGSSGRGSYDQARESMDPSAPMKAKTKTTTCNCSKEGKHYSESLMDIIVPGTPDRIHNLMFASGFIKNFMAVDQKLMDIQISDWTPKAAGSKLLSRNMSYIKPLNASIGPKQAKCELSDETDFCNFDEYVSMITTTKTPEVPSGGVFSVKTRTCIMWASPVTTRVWVTSQIEWTGRSFIKGIIETSAMGGQRTYHVQLEAAMREYIKQHQSEFIPEGMDIGEIALVPPPAPESTKGAPAQAGVDGKTRERERNQRAFQWAYDTFDGAYQVGCRSAKGAIELLKDAFDQSSTTTMLYIVIVLLLLSNLYTFTRMGPAKEDYGKRLETRQMEDREKWIHGVVTALWDELAAGKGVSVGLGVQPIEAIPTAVPEVQPVSWHEDLAALHKTLDEAEKRIHVLRESLNSVKSLDTNWMKKNSLEL